MTLALRGGEPAINGHLDRFNTIGEDEIGAATAAMRLGPLSGFLGGLPYGGVCVQRLETLWAQRFGVNHAIACNSATSGLLAAASCATTRTFQVSPYTMSATAAAPMLLGMEPEFIDITDDTFNMDASQVSYPSTVVVTNLFGHPAELRYLRKLCDHAGTLLIEDNAQSPFAAVDNDSYAGTIGHIGVFSLNVHKHIQCGEGGIVVTNDGDLALRIRHFINHGEMANYRPGLNLRMTEATAAVAIVQLNKAIPVVKDRMLQVRNIEAALRPIEWLEPPVVKKGHRHVYYVWAAKYNEKVLGLPRNLVAKALAAEGLPLVEGYVKPLYRLLPFEDYASPCPVAEDMYANKVVYFENCGWSPTPDQIVHFYDACKKIEDNLSVLRGMA